MRGRRAALLATTLTMALLSGGVASAGDAPDGITSAVDRGVAAASGSTSATQLQGDTPGDLQAALSGDAAAALAMVNQFRAANGLRPLREDGALTALAQPWAAQQATQHVIENDPVLGTPDKPLPGFPVSLDTFLQYMVGGDGSPTISDLVDYAKSHSPSVLLNPDINHVGIGWSISGSYSVLYMVGVEYDFNDISPADTFYNPVTFLYDVGVTTGYPDGGFHPTGTVTREAMAAFLYRFMNDGAAIPACIGTERMFTDVGTGHPFCGAIEWLAATGITTGYPDRTFQPGANVTREAMSAFLYRAFVDEVIPPCAEGARTFTDVTTGHPFCGAIEWMASSSISTGWPDHTFRPGLSVERQATAAFLYRLAL